MYGAISSNDETLYFRELAHDQGVPWTEYWSFLGCYTDMKTDSGLDKLEQYLAKRRELYVSNVGLSSKTPENSEDSIFRTPSKGQNTIFVSPEQINDDSDGEEFLMQRSDNPESPSMQSMRQINVTPSGPGSGEILYSGIEKNICNSTSNYMETATNDRGDGANELTNRFEHLSLCEQGKSSIERRLKYDFLIESSQVEETSVEDISQINGGKLRCISRTEDTSTHFDNRDIQCKKKLIENYDQEEKFDNSLVCGENGYLAEQEPFEGEENDRNLEIGNNADDTKHSRSKEVVTKKAIQELDDVSKNIEHMEQSEFDPNIAINNRELDPGPTMDSNMPCKDSKQTVNQFCSVQDNVDNPNLTECERCKTNLATTTESELSGAKILNTQEESVDLQKPHGELSAIVDFEGISKLSQPDVWRSASVSSVADIRAKRQKENQVKVFIQG